MTLTLTREHPDGTVNPDDYMARWNGDFIGRIVKQPGVPMGRPNWYCGIILERRRFCPTAP